MSEKIVLIAYGADQPGIISKISTLLDVYHVNILDIKQTITDGIFMMIMVLSADIEHLNEIDQHLEEIREAMNISIEIQRHELFQQMHRI